MLYREICKILGYFLLYFSVVLLIPLGVAAYYEFGDPTSHPQGHSTVAFAYTLMIAILLSGLFSYIGRKASAALYRREGLAVVVLVWVITPAISALPFLFTGTLQRFDQAFFEAVSGYTTTGASSLQAKRYDKETGDEIPYQENYEGIVNTTYTFYGNITPIRDPITHEIIHEGIEAISKALLFWRSFTQWLGGVGIVILFVALLPALGMGGKILFQAEAIGPMKEGLTPRIKETAIRLWKIYIGLSLVQMILLLVTNQELSWLDATTLTFSTVATGGFSIRNDGIASYHNVATELIVMIFMIVGSINFSLYYYAIKGKFYRLYESEFVLFLLTLLIFGSFAAWRIVGVEKSSLAGLPTGTFYTCCEAIKDGFFQVISIQTTTGFYTTVYDHWPAVVQVLLLILMYVGGMSGSTAGGIKVIRHYMLYRIVQNKIELLFRPQTVRTFRIGNREVDTSVATTVLCFFVVIIALSTLATFLYVMDGVDPETALGLMAASINNVGIAFRAHGPGHSVAYLSSFSTYCSSLWMVLGRLEFFAVLVLLVPTFWTEDS